MKKYYHSKKWLEQSQRRARKELRRKRKKRQKKALQKRKTNLKKRKLITYDKVKKKHKRLEIQAPEVFSLIENPEETLDFFGAVNEYMKSRKDIFLDLSQITKLTTDAILYVLSYLEFNRVHNYRSMISGNVPIDDTCNQILKTSGFFKYVYSTGPAKFEADADIYSIQSDTLVSPEKAADIKKFAMDKLKKIESKETKSIFEIIIECMANTKQHAYANISTSTKWWVMASYNKDAQSVHFTFLDNGMGIPTTIRKDFSEILKGLAIKQDATLIDSALEGEFRSRTKERYRGKGLPRIHETSKKGSISNLVVISRRGYVDKKKSDIKNLESPCNGTLLSWDFV